MINIKQDFDTVVFENMSWLLHFVKSKFRNPVIAEDLVQEIWIKVFRAYDSYYEDGKIRAWIMRIAQNHLRTYFSNSGKTICASLDAYTDEGDSLYVYLSDNETPEDQYSGNGLIDCGTYKFPYAARYITEEEQIALEYSFNLSK